MNRTRRIERVAESIKRSVAEVVQRELSDPRIRGLISVTRAEPSPDLRSAKVHFSILGSESDQRTTFRALESARIHIQRAVGDRLSLRWTPELFFKLDQSLKKAFEINLLINKAMAELEPEKAAGEIDEEDTEDGTEEEAQDETEEETDHRSAESGELPHSQAGKSDVISEAVSEAAGGADREDPQLPDTPDPAVAGSPTGLQSEDRR